MLKTKVERNKIHTPLAARMRPQELNDFTGHTNLLTKNKPLRQAIEKGSVGSLILYGPPGVGKTTLAEIIARKLNAAVERLSAVTAGVKDLREAIKRAESRRNINQATVLIVDEIHRFNKGQQDALLPAVEEGIVTLIGATTENPFYKVVSALVSRVEIVKLEQLKPADLQNIIKRALTDSDKGLKNKYAMSDKAINILVKIGGGDGRRTLNILERAAVTAKKKTITMKDIEAASQKTVIQYDKAGDAHYDTISAYIKSMRGSDADAALFYLFRMLAAGEDPKFIVRRMYIFTSEDIGNADPHALMLVDSAARALEWVGLPEAEYNLAHATIYLSAAPKSNSVTKAMAAAKQDVKDHGNAPPPLHITSKSNSYLYPHEYPESLVKQQYRPTVIQNNVYYKPKNNGFEKEVSRRIDKARQVLHNTPKKKT